MGTDSSSLKAQKGKVVCLISDMHHQAMPLKVFKTIVNTPNASCKVCPAPGDFNGWLQHIKGTLQTPTECDRLVKEQMVLVEKNKIEREKLQNTYDACSKTKCGDLEKAWENSIRALRVTRRKKCGKETSMNVNGGRYDQCAAAEFKKTNAGKRSSLFRTCTRSKCRKEEKAMRKVPLMM
jgi:hypothetical protein